MFNCVVLFLIVKDLFLNKFFFGCGKNYLEIIDFFMLIFWLILKKWLKGKGG